MAAPLSFPLLLPEKITPPIQIETEKKELKEISDINIHIENLSPSQIEIRDSIVENSYFFSNNPNPLEKYSTKFLKLPPLIDINFSTREICHFFKERLIKAEYFDRGPFVIGGAANYILMDPKFAIEFSDIDVCFYLKVPAYDIIKDYLIDFISLKLSQIYKEKDQPFPLEFIDPSERPKFIAENYLYKKKFLTDIKSNVGGAYYGLGKIDLKFFHSNICRQNVSRADGFRIGIFEDKIYCTNVDNYCDRLDYQASFKDLLSQEFFINKPKEVIDLIFRCAHKLTQGFIITQDGIMEIAAKQFQKTFPIEKLKELSLKIHQHHRNHYTETIGRLFDFINIIFIILKLENSEEKFTLCQNFALAFLDGNKSESSDLIKSIANIIRHHPKKSEQIVHLIHGALFHQWLKKNASIKSFFFDFDPHKFRSHLCFINNKKHFYLSLESSLGRLVKNYLSSWNECLTWDPEELITLDSLLKSLGDQTFLIPKKEKKLIAKMLISAFETQPLADVLDASPNKLSSVEVYEFAKELYPDKKNQTFFQCKILLHRLKILSQESVKLKNFPIQKLSHALIRLISKPNIDEFIQVNANFLVFTETQPKIKDIVIKKNLANSLLWIIQNYCDTTPFHSIEIMEHILKLLFSAEKLELFTRLEKIACIDSLMTFLQKNIDSNSSEILPNVGKYFRELENYAKSFDETETARSNVSYLLCRENLISIENLQLSLNDEKCETEASKFFYAVATSAHCFEFQKKLNPIFTTMVSHCVKSKKPYSLPTIALSTKILLKQFSPKQDQCLLILELVERLLSRKNPAIEILGEKNDLHLIAYEIISHLAPCMEKKLLQEMQCRFFKKAAASFLEKAPIEAKRIFSIFSKALICIETLEKSYPELVIQLKKSIINDDEEIRLSNGLVSLMRLGFQIDFSLSRRVLDKVIISSDNVFTSNIETRFFFITDLIFSIIPVEGKESSEQLSYLFEMFISLIKENQSEIESFVKNSKNMKFLALASRNMIDLSLNKSTSDSLEFINNSIPLLLKVGLISHVETGNYLIQLLDGLLNIKQQISKKTIAFFFQHFLSDHIPIDDVLRENVLNLSLIILKQSIQKMDVENHIQAISGTIFLLNAKLISPEIWKGCTDYFCALVQSASYYHDNSDSLAKIEDLLDILIEQKLFENNNLKDQIFYFGSFLDLQKKSISRKIFFQMEQYCPKDSIKPDILSLGIYRYFCNKVLEYKDIEFTLLTYQIFQNFGDWQICTLLLHGFSQTADPQFFPFIKKDLIESGYLSSGPITLSVRSRCFFHIFIYLKKLINNLIDKPDPTKLSTYTTFLEEQWKIVGNLHYPNYSVPIQNTTRELYLSILVGVKNSTSMIQACEVFSQELRYDFKTSLYSILFGLIELPLTEYNPAVLMAVDKVIAALSPYHFVRLNSKSKEASLDLDQFFGYIFALVNKDMPPYIEVAFKFLSIVLNIEIAESLTTPEKTTSYLIPRMYVASRIALDSDVEKTIYQLLLNLTQSLFHHKKYNEAFSVSSYGEIFVSKIKTPSYIKKIRTIINPVFIQYEKFNPSGDPLKDQENLKSIFKDINALHLLLKWNCEKFKSVLVPFLTKATTISSDLGLEGKKLHTIISSITHLETKETKTEFKEHQEVQTSFEKLTELCKKIDSLKFEETTKELINALPLVDLNNTESLVIFLKTVYKVHDNVIFLTLGSQKKIYFQEYLVFFNKFLKQKFKPADYQIVYIFIRKSLMQLLFTPFIMQKIVLYVTPKNSVKEFLNKIESHIKTPESIQKLLKGSKMMHVGIKDIDFPFVKAITMQRGYNHKELENSISKESQKLLFDCLMESCKIVHKSNFIKMANKDPDFTDLIKKLLEAMKFNALIGLPSLMSNELLSFLKDLTDTLNEQYD